MSLTDFRALGRSGLVVSPLCLGAMTFGPGEWGADEAASREIFDAYRDAGGNFVDTADTGRLSGANPFGDRKFTERNWAILDTLREVAAELDCTPAQAALAWAMSRPGVASTFGARARWRSSKATSWRRAFD